jgi:hypothetical protein
LDVLFRQVVVAPINAMLSPYAGRAVNGILGYDFLSRYVVEVDYAGRQVHLYDPDFYHYTGPYEPLPLSLINQHPHLKGVLTLPDGSSIEADFILDSGAAPALLLATPFVEAHGLLSSGLVAVPELAAGVGGAAPVMVGRMPALGFGPWRFENLTTYFSQSKGDAIAELLQADGIIGGQILRRYRVIWDYPHEQVILEPQLPGRSLKETAISGMLLKLAGTDYRRFMVDGIAPGSPAAEAGLLAGDRLLSVNDQWTLGLELDELYRCFTGGRRHRLLIERSQTHLSRILDLRRQP